MKLNFSIYLSSHPIAIIVKLQHIVGKDTYKNKNLQHTQ